LNNREFKTTCDSVASLLKEYLSVESVKWESTDLGYVVFSWEEVGGLCRATVDPDQIEDCFPDDVAHAVLMGRNKGSEFNVDHWFRSR
jgi:hypothetical protein